MTREVAISAMGVVSSLGQGLSRNLSALDSAPPTASRYEWQGADQVESIPFLAAQGGPDSAAERLHWLIDEALAELLQQYPLSADQRLHLPIFIGSSSYGIGVAEETYGQMLQANPELAVPIPLDGFSQIGNHLRAAYQICGPDFAFNTACTASANALLYASRYLLQGRSRQALVIGVEPFNLTTLLGFHGMQLISRRGMRPFDLRRDGLILGESCAALLLTRDAAESGISLCGGASNCDTFSISASNPDGSIISEVMEKALQDSALTREDIIAIKAHGTATPLNDNAEAASMQRLFARIPPFCSIKSYVGHTLGACGALETALVAGSLRQGVLPASGGFEQPDPTLVVSPIRQAMAARPGHYLLNYFGFGGNNCSLILRYRNN